MLIVVATVSYFTATVAFLSLAALLLTRWRDRLHGDILTVACLLSALWAGTIAYQVSYEHTFSLLTQLLEILRNAGWSLFLLKFLAPLHREGGRFFYKASTSVATIAVFFLSLIIAKICTYFNVAFAFTFTTVLSGMVGYVAQAIIGMLLVEQLFRNTSGQDRWVIKFACFGMGGLFAYDFYLYSDALLFRGVNIEIWAARGLINAVTVPLLAVSAMRTAQSTAGIAVSRNILFHSAALFGSAIYLLAMAAAGYYLRYFGGNWGSVMQAVFLFGAVVLLTVILFSGAFRSSLKVFISKNFYRYNYDYREEWIRFTRALSEGGPDLGSRTVQTVAELVESPGGAVYICRDAATCELLAHWNLSLKSETESANRLFFQFLENKQWVVDLQDYSTNPDKYDAVAIPRWLRESFKAWLVVPLILHGKLFGFIVLAQSRSRINLNWEVLDLLKIAGSQAASYLAQNEAATALMVARQFESFNRMSTFVVHDLKNLVSQLSLLVTNAEKHKHNPEFQQDMLETVDYSVQKMKLLLHKLSRGSAVESPASLHIDALLRQALATKSAFEPKPILQVLEPDMMVFANESRLERVIGHIIQNAIEATPKNGKVTIRLFKEENSAVIECEDSGHGMSEEFIRDRLFKPFESTKSAGMGIGVFETREYIQEIGGKLDVFSRISDGTTFRITLPLHTHVEQAMLNIA